LRSRAIGDVEVAAVVELERVGLPAAMVFPDWSNDLLTAEPEWTTPTYYNREDATIIVAMQSFLLKTKRHTILVDTCVGNDKPRNNPDFNRLRLPWLERLRETGTRVEDVDFVCCTHMHVDHVGWNTRLDNGRWVPTFPKARYIFAKTEWDHWQRMSKDNQLQRTGDYVADSVLPIVEAGRADLVALSFVHEPTDIDRLYAELDRLHAPDLGVILKIENRVAFERLPELLMTASKRRRIAVMVARGDLGVELPAEQVPTIQRRIVRACRRAGKPVIVATQMLESMISSPVPTRAEASDVATAIYHGADAVMLSAESASGQYPVEAVQMMERILGEVEGDPYQRELLGALQTPAQPTSADAICAALDVIAELLPVAAIVTYTTSGSTSLRAARERPQPPILSMTPSLATARRMALVWGVHSIHTDDATDVAAMVERACRRARDEGFAHPGDTILISAGMPFGTPGATNLLRIAQV